jgi:prevent-host-death family protein
MVRLAVDLARAEADLATLIEQVREGGEVLITRDGVPVARLTAATDTPPDRAPGSARGLFTVPDDFDEPLEDFREYM